MVPVRNTIPFLAKNMSHYWLQAFTSALRFCCCTPFFCCSALFGLFRESITLQFLQVCTGCLAIRGKWVDCRCLCYENQILGAYVIDTCRCTRLAGLDKIGIKNSNRSSTACFATTCNNKNFTTKHDNNNITWHLAQPLILYFLLIDQLLLM